MTDDLSMMTFGADGGSFMLRFTDDEVRLGPDAMVGPWLSRRSRWQRLLRRRPAILGLVVTLRSRPGKLYASPRSEIIHDGRALPLIPIIQWLHAHPGQPYRLDVGAP